MNILLVDDEKKFVTMLARRLDLRGFTVCSADTGQQAIETVKKGERFDVAVLDVKMPGIGGFELKRELQRLDPDMQFVFLTGHGSDIDHLTGDGRAELYLPKPLNINDLVNALRKVPGRTPGKTANG